MAKNSLCGYEILSVTSKCHTHTSTHAQTHAHARMRAHARLQTYTHTADQPSKRGRTLTSSLIPSQMIAKLGMAYYIIKTKTKHITQ